MDFIPKVKLNIDESLEIDETTDTLGTFRLIGQTSSIVTGDALKAFVLTGNPTTGDSDIVVDVLYRITDLP